MKVREAHTHGQDKIELQMTPMIDIVFQLLIFFIMTFKIVIQEGDFNIKMPAMAPSETTEPDDKLPPIPVRLTADANGNLSGVSVGANALAGQNVFASLRHEIMASVGSQPSPEDLETTELEIDADPNLQYRFVIDAITAVSGYLTSDQGTTRRISLVEKIKFAPPRASAN